jgi:epoxyqueuosine reductase
VESRTETLRRRLGELGFDAVRFASAGAAPGDLRAWLAAGRHADMRWMEATAAKRLDPALVLPGVRSIVALGVSSFGGPPPGAPGGPEIARYARHRDYHDTMKRGLVQAGAALEEIFGVGPADYRYYVDTGPVLERGWAARAGLGFIGKNAMLISRAHGNWLLLAAILTRAELAADEPASSGPGHGRFCGKCTRCLDACPTRAFPEPGVVDARRCISYQTIENRGVIPRELREGIGARVFGCDLCLEVCPWNRFARAGRGVLLEVRAGISALGWLELLEMTPGRFAALFRGTAIRRLKHAGFLRNACVGAGNSGDTGLAGPLARLAREAEPLVRVHAVWAVHRLLGAEAGAAALGQAFAAEADPGVLEEYAAWGFNPSRRPPSGWPTPNREA